MPQQYDQDGNPVRSPTSYTGNDNNNFGGYYAGTPAQKPRELTEAERIEAERARLIADLRRIAEGGGQAYDNTMRSVNTGNSRIAALAASGRGGLNAATNAKSASAMNTSAGHQQGMQNKAAEISQARSALGQVIAAGQDNSVQQGQDMLAALKANYSNVQPDQAQRYVGMAGQVGQAAWSAYGNQESGPTRQRGDSASDWSNRQNNW